MIGPTEKVTSITYSEGVFVALVIQHAMRMAILSSVTCLALPYFYTLFHKQHNFRRKKSMEYKTCVLVFLTTFVRFQASAVKYNGLRSSGLLRSE